MTHQPNTGHHYYAASTYGWAVGATRTDAIKNLVESMGDSVVNHCVQKTRGMFVATCRVMVPIETRYQIRFWQPTGVPTEAFEECRVVNAHTIKQNILQNEKEDVL